MAKTQLTQEEIEAYEADVLGADDLERHEYRDKKYVDIVRIESKSKKKKLKITYEYEGDATNKKLKNIKKEIEE